MISYNNCERELRSKVGEVGGGRGEVRKYPSSGELCQQVEGKHNA